MTAKRLLKRTEATLLILGALASSACGSDGAPGAGGNGGGNNGNGNNNGDTNGGGELDGGLDASMSKPDAEPGATGGPSVTDAGLVLGCKLEAEQLAIEIDNRGSHTWDAVQIEDTIHLVYEVPTCLSEPQLQAQRLDYLTFKSTGAFGKAEPIVNMADGACFFTRTPTLSPSKTDKPLLYYTSTASDAADLYQMQIGDNAAPGMLASGLTAVAEHIVASRFGEGKNLIAYVRSYPEIQPPPPSTSEVVTARPGLPPRVIFPQQEKTRVSTLALAEFPSTDELGGALAWVVDVVKKGETPRISLQPLDKSGDTSGETIELTKLVGTFSNVSIAILPEDSNEEYVGAVVYGVAPDDLHTELRFRTLAHDGTVGPEKSLTQSNQNAHSASITPFLDGYVVAYRNVDAALTAINLAFINTSGTMGAFGERTLIGALPSGGIPRVFVTNDGRVSVVFSDTNGQGTTLRAVRAICDP